MKKMVMKTENDKAVAVFETINDEDDFHED